MLPEEENRTLSKNVPIPPLLGMVLFGFLARNIPWPMLEHMDTLTNSIILDISLFFVMFVAGISLELDVLKKRTWLILVLALLPAIGETMIAFSMALLCSICQTCILNRSLYDDSRLNCSDGTNSPRIDERRIWSGKRDIFYTIAGITIDSIVSTLLFGIFLGESFNTKSKLMPNTSVTAGLVGSAIVEIIAALVIGIILGIVLAKYAKNYQSSYNLRH